MNVSEANAYQSLLRWLSDVEASDAADDRAVSDLVWLAGRAHDTLAAGHGVGSPAPAQRTSIWPPLGWVTASEEVAPKVLEHRDLVRRALAGLAAAQESDGAAQAVCRALADHQAHGGSIPWPSIRRPFEEWEQIREVDA